MGTHKPDYRHDGYLRNPLELDRQAKTVGEVCKYLRLLQQDYEAIAFRGMSGALIAPTVALRLKKTLIMVRKPETVTHSRMRVEGDSGAKRYIIIDDLISTGDTVRQIQWDIKAWSGAECLGTLEVNALMRMKEIGIPLMGLNQMGVTLANAA